MLVGSILTSIALSQYGNAQSRFAVRGARNTFVSLHARARATAIERGTTVVLFIDSSADSAAVRITGAGTIVEAIHFRDDFNVDLQSSPAAIRLCMTPRGYADDSCNSFSSAVKVGFFFNADSTTVEILPLGQLRY